MHQDYLLIATHLGTPIGPIMRALAANSEVGVNQTPISYGTPTDLQALRLLCRREGETRIVTDVALHNHSLRTMALGDVCMFVYLLGEPRRTITTLVQEHNYTAAKAYDYYAFRLQRLALLAKYTPRAMMLTMEMMGDEYSKALSKKLKLKNDLYFSVEGEDLRVKPAEGVIADKACAIYDRYLSQIQANLEEHTDVRTLGETESGATGSPTEKEPACESDIVHAAG